jgi:hypothetical protein
LITVQINEIDFLAAQFSCEPAFWEHQVSVPLVAGTLTYRHATGTQPEKRFRSGDDQHWIGVDLHASDVLY